MMTIPTLLVLTLLQPAQAATEPAAAGAPVAPAAKRSVLVLPVTVPERAAEEVLQTAGVLERGMTRAFRRHGAFKELTLAEVRERVGKAAETQMSGCDEESCLAGLAEALGADLLLQTRLAQEKGLWVARISMLDRRSATTTLRRELRVRSVDALLDSIDTLVRDLSGGAALVISDPALAERLGTTPAVADQLREKLTRETGTTAAAAWTDHIIDRNRESEVLAFAEGALLLLGGAAALVASVPMALVSVFGSTAFIPEAPAALGGSAAEADTYTFRLVYILGQGILTVILLTTLVPVSAAVALAVLDRMDLGRIPVRKDGCCRDEGRIRDAAKPGWGRRAAPFLALAAAAIGLLYPLGIGVSFFVSVPLSLALSEGFAAGAVPKGPSVQLPLSAFVALYVGVYVINTLGISAIVALGLVGSVGALLFIYSETAPVVDAE
jgi:hypothetical protein